MWSKTLAHLAAIPFVPFSMASNLNSNMVRLQFTCSYFSFLCIINLVLLLIYTMAEVRGLAVTPVLAKKFFFNPSLEILTPFRISLLIWPSLYIYMIHIPLQSCGLKVDTRGIGTRHWPKYWKESKVINQVISLSIIIGLIVYQSTIMSVSGVAYSIDAEQGMT